MRAVLKVLFWGLLAVTITVGGAYFYLRNADLNAYEEQIERFLTGIIGLQVDFDGRFDLRFGRTTTIAAENISLTNTAIADNSRILHVAAFEVSVNTWSLLSRPVVIENLVVGGASVALHRDADGHANWITDSAADASAVQARPRDSVELDVVVFRRVDLEDVRISLDDATRSHPVQATLHSLAVVPDAADMLDIDLDGVVGAYPLLVDGTVGPLQGLVSGRDIAADLRATLGLMQLTILGEVAELSGLEGLSLKIGAEGPGIERLIDAFALPPFAEGAFSLDFGIAPDANGNSVNAGGNIGSIVLSVDGRVDDLLSPNEAELDVAFSGPESAYVASLFGVEDATRAAFDVSGGFRKTASRFDLEDVDITLGRSRAQISGWLETGSGFPEFDILIEGSGPNLAVFDPFIPINGLPDKPYDIAGRLRKQDDEWLFDDVDAWIGENRITADGRAEGGGSVDGQIRFRATGPDLSVLRQITGIEQLPAGPYTVTANLRGATNGIRIHSASAEINGNHVDASGYVSVEQGGVGSEIDLRVSGPELATIGAFSGIPNLPDGAFDISGHINVERSKVSLSAVSVAVQELTATAGGNIYHDADVPRIEFDIDAAGPDIADVFPYSPLDRLTGEPFRVYGGLLVEGNDLTLTDLHALIGNIDIEVDASLDLSEILASDTIQVQALAPNADDVKALTDLAYLPPGPFLLELNVDSTDTTYVIRNSTVQIGDIGFDLDAEVGKSRPYSGNDISVFFEGPALREVGLIFGDPYLADKAFSLEVHLDGTETGFVMDTFAFNVGISEVSGSMSADFSDDTPNVEVEFNAPVIDFRDRIPGFTDDPPQDQVEADPATPPTAASTRVFSEEPLDLPWLELADIQVDVDVDRLLLPTGELTDFRLDANLADGNLVIDRFEVHSPQGGIDGQFSLTQEQGVFSASASLTIDDVRPPALAAEGLDPLTVPPIDVELRFSGDGQSAHDIVSGSNGHVFVFIDSGQVAVFGSEFFSGGLIEGIARSINPVARSRTYTAVDCGIADVDIVDGVVQFRQVAVQTAQITVISSGTINLDSERLRLTVRTFPREGLGVVSLAGIVNPFVRVAGTMQTPTLEIDPTSSATSAGAAVATGGLSVLARGLWDRFRGGANMCRNLPRERPDRNEAGGNP